MTTRSRVAALALAALLPVAAHADEGLWTFDNVPAAKVKAAYGVDITPAWLAKVQAASVRLSIGCSASVLSDSGLMLTNDHCVTDCAQDAAPAGADYRRDGFLASARTDERKCPGLDAEILVGVTDVTARVNAAGAGRSGLALVKAREAVSSAVAAETCGGDARYHCELVGLYGGGQFKLYKYRKYADVRLVFTPGDRAAFFGGDPENFNFPRFDLDCAFLRLYEDGKPAATPDHLRFDATPPKAGEPVFTSGNPGGTFRDDAVSQVLMQRDLATPLEMTRLSELRGRIIAFGESGPDNQRVASNYLEDLENDYKVTFGRFFALADEGFIARKRASEADLIAKARAKLGPGLGDPWADMAKAEDAARTLFVRELMLEADPVDSDLFGYARGLVRAAEERPKPSAERLPEYADGELPIREQELLDPHAVQPKLERINMEFWLSKVREYLGPSDPDTQLLLGRESPEGLADRLVGATRLADPAFRKALWDGGQKAIEATDDPMIQFALKIDPAARRIRTQYEDRVTGPAAKASEAIAKARFAVYGDSIYPDGTFTLRLSYGAVKGWTSQGRAVPPFTTFAGLYASATGAPPFDLDPRWVAAQARLNPDTVFNFVTTNDIIGGNSGSPVLDARAAVIGTAFDGNLPSLGGDYGYDAATNRTVALSSAAIAEALKKVYGADALLAELGVDWK
ncbi:MAG TPA: S46 family peptidase [Caulobacteraceae bacterium]|nr:S46 family peptidase [Caulobacteraceae bacterium]